MEIRLNLIEVDRNTLPGEIKTFLADTFKQNYHKNDFSRYDKEMDQRFKQENVSITCYDAILYCIENGSIFMNSSSVYFRLEDKAYIGTSSITYISLVTLVNNGSLTIKGCKVIDELFEKLVSKFELEDRLKWVLHCTTKQS